MARFFLLAIMALSATPASAASSIQVPEPSELGLFALAVLGLIIGRHTSRRTPPPGSDDDA